MDDPSPARTVHDLLGFYRQRGYRARIGPGVAPAVLVIDFSNAFTQGESHFPGGDFGSEVNATVRLVDAARRACRPVIFTTIAYADPASGAGWWGVKVPWLAHCRHGSPLVEIDARLARRETEPVIAKPYPSAFFQTDLEARLRAMAVDTLVIAGCTTSVCVRATTLDAMQRGFRPLVAADAVGDFDPSLHALHLADLDARYGDVMPVDALVRYLQTGSADAPPAGQ